MYICEQCGTDLRPDQTMGDNTRCVYCGGPVEAQKQCDACGRYADELTFVPFGEGNPIGDGSFCDDCLIADYNSAVR